MAPSKQGRPGRPSPRQAAPPRPSPLRPLRSLRPPPSSLAPRRTPELKRYLLWSAGGHALLLVAVLGLSAWNSDSRLNLDQKPIQARLVRRGQPRDAKLLPRIEEPPPPPPRVETPPPPVPAPPPEAPKPVAVPGLKPEPPAARAEPQKGADDATGRRSRLFDAFAKTSKRAQDDPLEGAPDGDPEGDSATAEGDPYFGLISRNIHRNYDVSSIIPEKDRQGLSTVVLLRIGPGGEIQLVKVATPSGNALFDNAVLAAVKKAVPFPAPPAHLRDTLRKGVPLRFTP